VRSILVVNPKGGSGKTTVATNLASGLAARGRRVLLWDLDRQQSAMTWLSMRPAHCPRIVRLDRRDQADGGAEAKGAWLVVDSPAGIHGKGLSHALRVADKVLVPLQPSVFDMAATGDFLKTLSEEKSIRKGRAYIGVIGVRVDPRTRAAATLEAFLRQFDLPILAFLRDSQVYPNAAFNGLSIFDLPPSAAERDQAHWQAILTWVTEERHAGAAPGLVAAS
jgi:chromosome partitioning protein